MKQQNPLSVNAFSRNIRWYITHPWSLFKDIYWNMRNFMHRGRFGYAYVDVWNFCDWYPRVGAEALRYLARHNSGYPAVKPWNSTQAWREYLEYLANRLERCADSMDICFGGERNEYKEQFDEIMHARRKEIFHEDGSITIRHELTAAEKEIQQKYWAREEELHKADQEYNKETFKWLDEDLPHLWD